MPIFTKEELYSTKGHMRTSSLFVEKAALERKPFLSLRAQHQTETGISLRDYFIHYTINDPTETVFAEEVFGEWRFWENLLKCKWFTPYVEDWRREADIKRKAMAFQAILKEIKEDGRSSFTAAKYLIEEPWKEKTKASKAKTKETTKEAYNSISSDIERLKEQGLLQ